MVNYKLALLASLVSFSALARVSHEEKLNRVKFIEQLSITMPVMNLEAYRRELNYEKAELPLEERAQIETNILAEKIKTQVSLTYNAALERLGDEDAAQEEVKTIIENDLSLAAPDLREELEVLALDALTSARNGGMSESVTLVSVEESMLKNIRERSQYLNYETAGNDSASTNYPVSNRNRDSERLNYKSKQEVISSLVSDRENARWSSSASMDLSSSVSRRSDGKISFQFKVNFLGVALDAGPTISIKKEIKSSVKVLAEGLNPILQRDGNFDFFKRDRSGNIVVSGGKNQKRYVSFYCESSLEFETDYAGGGNFSIMGLGGGASFGQKYSDEVNLTSRRVLVPEYVDNKSVTMLFLQRLCLNDYLRARINNTMTVKQSMEIQMRNMLSSLQFSHPKTKCAVDSQCKAWFRQGMIGVVGNAAFPRCVEERREKYRACEVRALRNQKCPLFKNGKRITAGMFEYACDVGLKCLQTKEEGWFKSLNVYQYGEGRCVPVNPKSYRAPRL